jgi:glycosyltransferase involved in cell wall biosynthesis
MWRRGLNRLFWGHGVEKIKVIHVYKDFNVYNGLVEILTILAGGMDLDRFELGACVFRYDGNSFGDDFQRLGGRIHSLNISKSLGNEIREFNGLRRFFDSFRPDIVQTHVLKSNLLGILAARKAKVPVIIGTEMTLKDIAHTPMTRLRDKLIQPLVSLSLRYSDSFMVTSEYIKKQWYHRRYSEKYRVIYPPFNLDKYLAVQANAQCKAPQSNHHDPTIGFVGRLSEEKGLQTLLEAMAAIRSRIPRVRLLIAGTGPIEHRLRKFVQDTNLGNSVSFMGFCSNVFKMMGDLDVFVLPSRTEGCPIVVLEAMAMGVPVVATNVGGTPELVENNVTGLLVKSNAPDELARSIVELLTDRERAEKMGRAGHERAFSVFHPKKFIESIEHMYLELLTQKNGT